MNTSSLLPFMALLAGLFYGTTFAAEAAEDLPAERELRCAVQHGLRTLQQLGMQLLQRVAENTSEVAKVESYPRLEGRQMLMVLAPK